MSEFEQLRAELMASATGISDDKLEGREKAANQWVAHYISVKEAVDAFEAKEGRRPNKSEAIKALVDTWVSKDDLVL